MDRLPASIEIPIASDMGTYYLACSIFYPSSTYWVIDNFTDATYSWSFQNVFHLQIFGCVVYVSIAPPQRTKMGPQRRLDISVEFDSPSIIKYIEPLNEDLFKARFEDN